MVIGNGIELMLRKILMTWLLNSSITKTPNYGEINDTIDYILTEELTGMENKKMIIDNLTLDEVGLLHTSLKGMIIKMKELEVPEFFIEMAIPLLDQIDNILDKKVDEQKTFIELVGDQLDDVLLASSIIEKDPDVVIPEYK